MLSHNTYKLYLMMCDEIKKHKWIESEKAGRDIGFEDALVDWVSKHRKGWCDETLKHKQNVKN